MHNQTIIVGRVGRDAEQRFTPQGQAVTSFSVATNRKYNGKDETTWFKVTVWGKQAETCGQYVKKGMLVLVEGRLVCDPATGGPRIWDNKGKPAASFELNGDEVRFLSKVEQEAQASTEDEIPF